jgi:predicted porin
MKKVLFSTTALAAASVLALSATDVQAAGHTGGKAKPLSIKVGGFMTAMVGFSEQSGSFESTTNATSRVGYDSFNQWNDSEIYFRGTTKLDNGVSASVTIQIEADQANNGTQVDESYLKLTGGFGDVRLGSTKKAGFVLSHGAPRVGNLPLTNNDTNNWIVKPDNNNAMNFTNTAGADSMSVVYISPKISGLRLGLTYVASSSTANTPPAVGGNAGTDNQIYDAIVSYEDKVGSMDLKADVGYMEQHGIANSSFSFWRGGIVVGFGAVSVGGAYKAQSDIDTGKGGTANSDESEVYEIGISYASGPFKVSATYLHGEQPLASATQGEDEVDKFQIGGQYNMGPGVDLQGSLTYVDWNDETTADANNNDGWAVVGGVKVSF